MRQASSDGAVPLQELSDPILLVEDNVLNQRVALVLLERMGLTAEVACNGKEAVDAVRRKKFALVLMDCHMPEMDGFEATVEIRKFESENQIYTPIIAVTALAMAGDRERCIAAGMDDYISKPIDRDILKAKISHWMRTDVVFRSQKSARKNLRPKSEMMVLESNPIDLNELEEFYGAEQLSQMLTIFVTDTKDMLGRIGFYLKECNSRAIAGLAHEVKASCASLGAKHLSRLCLYLEQAVGQQDWIEAAETLHALERSFDHLETFIAPAIKSVEEAATS